MKSYIQFCEDLQQRRVQLAKRQKEGVVAFKKRISSKSASFRERLAKRKEREALKKEIKRELQTEQTHGLVSSIDKFARDTAGRVGGEIGAAKGKGTLGNVLGIPERIGRNRGTQQGRQIYDKSKQTVGNLLSQSYDPYFEDIDDVDEQLRPNVVRAAARQQYKSQAVKQRVRSNNPIVTKPQSSNSQLTSGVSRNTPQKVSMTRLYHGTTRPASQNISQSGWRTDTNVTRQMQGSGVYTTPQKPAAQMYANQRAAQRGENPAVRTFRIPTKTFDRVKAQRQQQGSWNANKGGQQFNIVQMSPKGANRYDITDKPQSAGAIQLRGGQRQELRQRTSTALSKPQNRSALKRDIRGSRISRIGGSSSLSNAGSPSGPSAATGRYQVGGSRGYGISGIRLADHYDVYDIVLSYLLDEGYAKTIESAEEIMLYMNEEWRNSILFELN